MPDTVTEATFEQEVLESDKPVLVDFWAEWCGPCHAIAPVLDQIARSASELKVVKLNIDEEPAIAQRYGVMSIPTLILFKEGETAAAAIGASRRAMPRVDAGRAPRPGRRRRPRLRPSLFLGGSGAETPRGPAARRRG